MTWWRGRPLRTRLVVSSIALLAVVLSVIAVVSTFAIQGFLMRQLDQRVRDTGSRAMGALYFDGERTGGPDGGSGGTTQVLDSPGTDPRALAVQLGSDGSVLSQGVLDGGGESARPRVESLSDAQVEVVAGVPEDDGQERLPDPGPYGQQPRQGGPDKGFQESAELHTRSIPGLGDYRLIRVKDDRPQSPHHGESVVIGLPMGSVQDSVRQVVTVEIAVAAAGLVAAGVAIAVIVKLSLRPLRRVADTATRVSRQNLHEGEVGHLQRVPAGDTDARTEVGQVGASLNRLLDHVASALAARHASETRVRQFVADASHELRTPLASIRGYAELTRMGREAVPPDTAYALRRVEAEATRMTLLVEDLLLLARLDAGRPLEKEPVDLSPLVIDAVTDASVAGPGHHWRLDVPDEPVQVDADPLRLQQVLVNLLGNARTHTPPGTVVTASVHREGPHATVRVTDDGPGIPPETLPNVFERFARGDTSRSRAAGSTGLGLAIVAAVVSAHGGTVDVTSVPGHTAFTVRLPVLDTAAHRAAPPHVHG